MPVPTWRLALLAAVAALAALAAPAVALRVVVVANIVVFAAGGIDWLRAVRPETLTVTRDLPPVVMLKAPATLRWQVHNPAPHAVSLRLADDLAPSLSAERRRVALRVPAGGATAAATRLQPQRRGRFRLESVTLRVEGPWGLVARQATQALPQTLRVYPPFRSRAQAELRVKRARMLEAGMRSAVERGSGTDFEGLREYGPDDEFRRIDWAATARARRPIVRTYRAERNQNVLVLLDSGRVMAGLVGDPPVPRLDHGLDAALALTAVATGLGDRAGLVTFADRVRGLVPPGGGSAQLSRVSEALYALDPRLVESDYRSAFATTLAHFRRRALLVVITELAAAAVPETLLPALPLVVRDHLVVVAGVRDPAIDDWARAIPAGSAGAYRKAAAVQALDGRARTVARLRGAGATVVDAPPLVLPGVLADTYLQAKNAGRL